MGEGRQPGRRSWPGVDRDLRAEGPIPVSGGDPHHARPDRACGDAADDPARDKADPAVDGTKSELQDAVWDEVDFENAVWSIPKERMKRSKAHNVYLSQQMLDIFIALKTCAGNSKYVLPSRYDADAPMSRATFNRITTAVVERAKKEGLPLESFTVHDLRRTGSTLLNELGFNSDWIEKCWRMRTGDPHGASTTRRNTSISAGI
jgi:integrase